MSTFNLVYMAVTCTGAFVYGIMGGTMTRKRWAVLAVIALFVSVARALMGLN
jgi:hypothetical protein